MTEIRLIDVQHSKDINLPNEPFILFGRLIPKYSDGNGVGKRSFLHRRTLLKCAFPTKIMISNR